MTHTEKKLESHIAYEGTSLDCSVDKVRSTDGQIGTREYLRHPGAVMIVPVFSEVAAAGAPVSISAEADFNRIPGREDPTRAKALIQCAQREPLEETGYRAGKWCYASVLHNAIAYSDEKNRNVSRRRAPARRWHPRCRGDTGSVHRAMGTVMRVGT